jgi:hypothetical protein
MSERSAPPPHKPFLKGASFKKKKTRKKKKKKKKKQLSVLV